MSLLPYWSIDFALNDDSDIIILVMTPQAAYDF